MASLNTIEGSTDAARAPSQLSAALLRPNGGDGDGDPRDAAGALPLPPRLPTATTLLAFMQVFPQLSKRRQLLLAVLIFLCERALPVLVLSTALQTGYNYAALYVLAPGHMYSSYLGVISRALVRPCRIVSRASHVDSSACEYSLTTLTSAIHHTLK